MPRSFDCVLINGTVVNHDGVGLRDIGDSRRAHRRDRSLRRRCGGRAHRLPGPAHSSRRHRFPGAFSRAGPRSQGGPGDRLARRRSRRGHGRVRNAQHRSGDDQRGGARRQASPRERPHALRLRLLGRRHARQRRRHSRTRAPARRGGDQGVHGLLDRAPAGRRRRRRAGDPQENAPARRLPQRRRGAPQRAQSLARSGRPSRRIPSGATKSRRCAQPSASSASRARRARKCMCCISRRARRWSFWPARRTSRAARRRRII